jgi:hypothetical protein
MKKTFVSIALMLTAALFIVACGDDDPKTDIGGACTDGQMKCEGDVFLWCEDEIFKGIDCSTMDKTCSPTQGCVTTGGTDDTNPTDNATGTDNTVPQNCGNGTTDSGEACDGDAKDCTTISASYTGGWAECKADCSGYDTTACVGATDEAPDTDTVTPTGKTCIEINQCTGACADQACYDACVASGSTVAQGQFNALMTCVTNNCATECGSGGTNETCNACAGEKCEDEMDACFTIDVAAYGTINGPSTAFNYIYDGDGDLNAQINANQAGLLMNAVFTGTYGASNKPIPGAGAQQTIALAMHGAADGTNPAYLAVLQQSQTQQGVVNPILQLMFPTDAITPGQYDMDPTKEGAVVMIMLNAVGSDSSCLLAYGFSGTTSVTAANNTTAASGGSITFGVTNSKVYYPTETPVGDISGSFTGISICPKE